MNARHQMVHDLARNLSEKLTDQVDRQLAVARLALDGHAVAAVYALALQTTIEIWLAQMALRRRRDVTPTAAFNDLLAEMHAHLEGARERVVTAVERTEANA